MNDEKRKLIHSNDEIEFLNVDDTSQSLLVSVVNIWCFDSFCDLYNKLPLLKCGYTAVDIKNAKASDMDIYYSKEKQKQFGVIGIEVKVI